MDTTPFLFPLLVAGCGVVPPAPPSLTPPAALCPPADPDPALAIPASPVQGAVLGVDYGAGGAEPPWSLLRDRGVEFVYLKASKATVVEPGFAAWWRNAGACGLKRGAYHWVCAPGAPASLSCPASPLSDDPAAFGRAQGEALVEALGDDPGELPPVLDVESTGGFEADAREANLNLLRAAATAVKRGTGTSPIVYGGTVTFARAVCAGADAGCCDADWDPERFWQAAYQTHPPTLDSCWAGQDWSLWQYAAGSDGQPDVDLARRGALPGL